MVAIVVGLFALVACIAINAFFVAAEYALLSVRRTWVEEMVLGGNQSALAVKAAVAQLTDVIAATQLGITVASIAIGALGEPAIARLIRLPLERAAPGWYPAAVHPISVMIAFVGVSFLDAVLGELVPKAIAISSPGRVALRLAGPLLAFQRVFRPFVRLLAGSASFVVRLLGFQPRGLVPHVYSVGELKRIVAQTEAAGSLDPTQADVVENALGLTEKRVRDVMVPRAAVQQLILGMTDREVLETVFVTHRTRLPVYSPTERDWIGVAVTKLFLSDYLQRGRIDLDGAMYRADVFHQAAPLPRVLRAFREHRQHLAFVAADDGTRIGIVTLEDVLEELVGEIEDEMDARPRSWPLRPAASGQAAR